MSSTGWPASSPYATGIGGVSAVLDSHQHLAWQTSWGPNLTEVAVNGIRQYVDEVKTGKFPDDDHSYSVDEREYEKFLGLVEKRRQH